MARQIQAFEDDKLDPAVAKAADHYVELTSQEKDIKERRKKSSAELIRQLKKLGKTRVRHKDQIIEVSHKEEVETIKIKKAKQPPVKKVLPLIQAPGK